MILARYLEDLKSELWEYYGQLNEIRMGLKVDPETAIAKPEELIRYEQAKDLGIPYVDGGLQDQPYIWLMEHGVINRFLDEWEAVHAQQQATKMK